MKIDVFNHVFPPEFFEQVEGLMPAAAVKRWKSIKTIYDMDARLRMLDEFEDYSSDHLHVTATDRRHCRPGQEPRPDPHGQ